VLSNISHCYPALQGETETDYQYQSQSHLEAHTEHMETLSAVEQGDAFLMLKVLIKKDKKKKIHTVCSSV